MTITHTYWNINNVVFKETLVHTAPTKKPRSIWFIHDNKPGHHHQLQGLEERIASDGKTTTFWINAQTPKLVWNFFSLKGQTKLTPPDIIIAAGHKTHLALLVYAYFYKAYAVVLMKPSLPMCLFDAVICPEHDKLKASKRVFNTRGALNTVHPPNTLLTKTLSLMLIGGPSKHFDWNEEKLIDQIRLICQQDSNIQWLLSNSPRTPCSFFSALQKANIKNLNFLHFQDTNLKPLHQLMLTSNTTWITPDSVSMVYESLTAQTPTFTFTLPPKKKRKLSRVASSMNTLMKRKDVISFETWQLHPDLKPNKLNLWEADRAAKWLLSRYSETYKNGV